MQQQVLLITLALLVPVFAAFIYVVRTASHQGDASIIQATVGKLRTRLIWLMVAVGVPLAAVMVIDWPHSSPFEHEEALIVEASSGQWYWDLSHYELPADTPITFRITTVDVTHGFGLYDADYQLLTQAQAIPGFASDLQFKFEKAGTYQVACLEYCGAAHHAMIAEITVLPKDQYGAEGR